MRRLTKPSWPCFSAWPLKNHHPRPPAAVHPAAFEALPHKGCLAPGFVRTSQGQVPFLDEKTHWKPRYFANVWQEVWCKRLRKLTGKHGLSALAYGISWQIDPKLSWPLETPWVIMQVSSPNRNRGSTSFFKSSISVHSILPSAYFLRKQNKTPDPASYIQKTSTTSN